MALHIVVKVAGYMTYMPRAWCTQGISHYNALYIIFLFHLIYLFNLVEVPPQELPLSQGFEEVPPARCVEGHCKSFKAGAGCLRCQKRAL